MSEELRIGQGLDVHRLVEGRPLIIGGVTIQHTKGLLGHSDADVLCHAIMDALLGASGKADIGARFPDSDPRWKGANSLELLRSVWKELLSEGFELNNLDCYLLAEEPRLGPHFAAMKSKICAVLACLEENCSIRATTTEKLGFIGRGEGILAQAVVLLRKKRGHSRVSSG